MAYLKKDSVCTTNFDFFFFAWRVFKRSNTKPFEAIAGNLKVRPLEPDPQIETKGPDKA